MTTAPEPVAAEQARSCDTCQVALRHGTKPECNGCTLPDGTMSHWRARWGAALASQSTPPPESAGLSVVRRKPRAYLHYAVKKPSMQRLAWTADLLTQEKASGWATIELVEQANRTAQPDGGSGK